MEAGGLAGAQRAQHNSRLRVEALAELARKEARSGVPDFRRLPLAALEMVLEMAQKTQDAAGAGNGSGALPLAALKMMLELAY